MRFPFVTTQAIRGLTVVLAAIWASGCTDDPGAGVLEPDASLTALGPESWSLADSLANGCMERMGLHR